MQVTKGPATPLDKKKRTAEFKIADLRTFQNCSVCCIRHSICRNEMLILKCLWGHERTKCEWLRVGTLTVCVYGVLGAGRGGGLRAVAAGAVQRVPASPGGVRIQRTQRERQLIPGRARLQGRGRRGWWFCTSVRGLWCKEMRFGFIRPYLPGCWHGPSSLPVVDLLRRGQQAVLRRPAPSGYQLAGGADAVLKVAHQLESEGKWTRLRYGNNTNPESQWTRT